MSSQWYFRVFGQEMGPLDRQGLMELVRSGQLGPDDSLRQEGSDLWIPAARVTGLFGKASTRDSKVKAPESAAASEPPDSPQVPRSRSARRGPVKVWLLSAIAALILIAASFFSWQAVSTPRFPEPRAFRSSASLESRPRSSDWSTMETLIIALDAALVIGALSLLAARRLGGRDRLE